MINRNVGSGTRILVDELLQRVFAKDRLAEIPGYRVQTKSHNAVAAAISQGRADWGVAIDTVARQYGLGAIPIREEQYDFCSLASGSNPRRSDVLSSCLETRRSVTACELWDSEVKNRRLGIAG